jgi:hypothetical protein
MATPWRLTRLLIKYIPQLQAQDDLRLATVQALPYQKEQTLLKELQAQARGKVKATKAVRTSSLADIMRFAKQPGMKDKVVIRRKAEPDVD